MYLFRREFDEAGISMERALALNPSDPQVIANHAHWLCRVGRYEEALSEYDLVIQRDPFPPSWYWEGRAIALFALQRYEDAIQSVRKMDRLYFWDYAVLAACYALLGRMDKARAAASEVLKMKPDFAIRDMMLQEPWKNPAEIERELDGLRKAGLPE